jgi:hypothetical protein
MDVRRPSVLIAFLSFSTIASMSVGLARRVVPDRGEAEEVRRQLGASGVKDERTPDPERAAEQTGLEHDVVPWRRLARLGDVGRRPVVQGEHERGEVDLLGELDEAVECVSPRVERGRPELDVGDVGEATSDRSEKL